MKLEEQSLCAGIYALSRGLKAKNATFLQNIAKKTKPNHVVDIDFYVNKGVVTLAYEAGFGNEGRLIQNRDIEKETYRFPIYKDRARIVGSQLLIAPPTHHRYKQWSREDVQTFWITRILEDLYSNMLMRREKMVAELLLTGKISCENTKDIDLKRSAKCEKTVDKKWNTNREHQPSQDIADLALEIEMESGEAPDGILMNRRTYQQMKNSKALIEEGANTFTDVRYFERAKLPSNEGRGAVHVGSMLGGIDIWVYNKTYTDDEGKSQSLIPDGKVIVGSFNAQNKNLTWYFGATDSLQTHLDIAKRNNITETETLELLGYGEIAPTAYEGEDYLQFGLQSSFLCLPQDINRYGVLTVH